MASGNHKMTIKTGIRGESVNNLGQCRDKVPAQQQSALPWHGMQYYRPRERGELEESGKSCASLLSTLKPSAMLAWYKIQNISLYRYILS